MKIMCQWMAFASTATLLIGLQLFYPNDMGKVARMNSYRLATSTLEAATSLPTPDAHQYTPPDRGGPDQSQGSGSRT